MSSVLAAALLVGLSARVPGCLFEAAVGIEKRIFLEESIVRLVELFEKPTCKARMSVGSHAVFRN